MLVAKDPREENGYILSNKLISFCSLFLLEYDQQLEEDPRVNRLNESLRLFGEIVNSKWFATVPMALILNKPDIFS